MGLLTISSLFFIGCSIGSTQNQKNSTTHQNHEDGQKDEVICRQLSDPSGLNPTNTYDAGAGMIKKMLFQTLLNYDTDLKLIPVLAKKLPIVEQTANGEMLIEYEIREEAVWDNGTPITAEDVVFTFKAARNLKVDAANIRSSLEFIKDIKTYKNNPKRLTFVSDNVNFLGDHITGTDVVIAPKYIYDPQGLSDKFSYVQIARAEPKIIDSPENRAFADHYNNVKYQREIVIGSGPYCFKEWKTDQFIAVERKENWWGDQILGENIFFAKGPQIIKMQTVNDATSAITALKGGKLDVMRSIPARAWTEDIQKSKKMKEEFHLLSPNLLYYSYLGLNTKAPQLRDKEVRKALAHLVDVDLINENLLYGLATRVVGPISPFAKDDYNNNIKPYNFDIDKAKALLAKAGWEDTDGNGIVDKIIDGKRTDLNITMSFPQGNDSRKSVGLIVKEAARQVGIEMMILPIESSVFLERLKANKIDIWYGAWGFDPRPNDPRPLWHSDSTNGGSNFTGFGNAQTDQLIETICQELDPTKRSVLYKEWQEILHEEVAYIFLFTGKNCIAVNKHFDKNSINVSEKSPGYHLASFRPAKGALMAGH